LSPNALLQALADSTPSPGGGSAAAMAGALSASLVAMVAGISAKKGNDEARTAMERVAHEAKRLMAAQSARIEEDDQAYQAVVRAYRLPKETDEDKMARRTAIRRATEGAGEVPLATARDAVAAIGLLASAIDQATKSCTSDMKTSVATARAAFDGALATVQANVDALEPSGVTCAWAKEIARLEAELRASCDRIATGLEAGGGGS
jgi:formiminotetrahydrofolate cyclodeaminase